MAGSIPTRDAELLGFSVNVKDRITATPTAYGLTIEQAAAYTVKHDLFATRLQESIDPITRTRPIIEAKNMAKKDLVRDLRTLRTVIVNNPAVTNEQLLELGFEARHKRMPVPPPDFAPDIDILSVVGRKVQLRLHNSQTIGHRGKPAGVKGATVFSYAGETPPAQVDDWKFETSTTRTTVELNLPADLEPGTKVWVTCFWFNGRSESGPAATPISTLIQYSEQPQLKLAGSKKAA